MADKIRTLGVLTGGGDVPGLNAAIKALVYRAEPLGINVVGLRGGWKGISFLNRALGRDRLIFSLNDKSTWADGYLIPLNRLNTTEIDRAGGTILQSTRTNPGRVKVSELPPHLTHLVGRSNGHGPAEYVDLTPEVLANIDFLGLDGLVVIGGDDTLSYAAVLSERGVPVWGVPKTMDNDVPGTEYCIGFQTAINRATEYIDRTRSTASSHGETMIFRLFGRDAGFTAIETAIAAWADRVLIPEVPTDIDHLAELVAQDRCNNPYSYSVVVISEGANLGVPVPEIGPPDPYGHRKKINLGEFLAGELANRLPGVRFLPIDLTYILRSGQPDVYDRRMSIFLANMAMTLVEEGRPAAMAAYRDGHFVYTELPGKQHPPRRVDPADYNLARYRPNFEGVRGAFYPQARFTG